MSSNVTVWQGGVFGTLAKPEWWDEAIDHLWSGPGGEASSEAVEDYDQRFRSVMVYRLEKGTGRIAYMGNGTDEPVQVFLPLDADYLAFMVGPVARWLSLDDAMMPSLTEQVQAIKETLIGYARWGAGEHISRYGETNGRDLQQDRVAERARARARKEQG